jgi:ribonuclease PH
VRDHVAAVSVGVVDSRVLLDLEYTEDVGADVDANVVMTGVGGIVEVQGTAEGSPFSRSQLDEMLDLAAAGIARLVVAQQEAIAG